ncbi:MAG: hypothetical protein VYA30_08715, partial [Myxococcota bacterium]|nr:hypothetical protein [Myxococcota bacterium]
MMVKRVFCICLLSFGCSEDLSVSELSDDADAIVDLDHSSTSTGDMATLKMDSGGTGGEAGTGGTAGAGGEAGTGGEDPPAPTCDDLIVNGLESDVDCGGNDCQPCVAGFNCRVDEDCQSGVCGGGLCAEPACGDRVLNGGEQCDDGNLIDGDGCQADCTLPTCGNNMIDPGEGSCDCPDNRANIDEDPANGCECEILSATDESCDGIDDDCSGDADEDYIPEESSCGVGACRATGMTSCNDGNVVDDCTPGEPANDDESCDGADNDCDGMLDEDHLAAESQCGAGACSARGLIECNNGALIDTCEPSNPSIDDSTCDGVDDDCDGSVDEDFVSPPDEETDCGGFDNACSEVGTLTVRRTICLNGELRVNEAAMACNRDTDGTVTNQPEFGQCVFADACAEAGQQTRTNTVCRNGVAVDEDEAQDCGRDTDGTVTNQPEFGQCVFADACAEAGQQTRTNTVCRNGVA